MERLDNRLEIDHVSEFSENAAAIQAACLGSSLFKGSRQEFLRLHAYETELRMLPEESRNEISQIT
jgi:hypothetical protein